MSVTGLIPAAGLGRRFGMCQPKEVAMLDVERGTRVCQFALEAIKLADVSRIVVVISPAKALIREILDQVAGAVELVYVEQPEPKGLPDAVRCARAELNGDDVLFAMPDTVFAPADALRTLSAARHQRGADIVLGVFPTVAPTDLAPVELDTSGQVSAMYDKPAATRLKNTWGIVTWSPRFTEFCAGFQERHRARTEATLTEAMDAARRSGWGVSACVFTNGAFVDAGTPGGLAAARVLWAERLGHRGDSPGRSPSPASCR